MLQLAQPMTFLGYTVSEIRQGLVDIGAVVEVAKAAEAERASYPSEKAAPEPAPAVAFRDVWAARDGGGEPALRGASFEAVAGGVTVLAGASGSGKSTALRVRWPVWSGFSLCRDSAHSRRPSRNCFECVCIVSRAIRLSLDACRGTGFASSTSA